MKKAIELADTTFRAYKKKNGAIALHLRTHLIVYADADFRAKLRNSRPSLKLGEPMKPFGLSAFLKERPRCWIQLPARKPYECELSYSCFPERRSIERPAGGIWVTYDFEDITDEECVLFFFLAQLTIGDKKIERLSIADMKLVFHTNFPGRASNEKIVIRRKIPIVKRGRGW
ncbi:MAG: hypothetical protein ABSH15_02460 [Verrucomicrobiota bacterium]